MRLTHVLRRCAALVRGAARHVGRALGHLGRTVVRAATRALAPTAAAVTRAVVPATSAVRARLGRLARVVIPVMTVACNRHEAPPASPPPAPAVETVAVAQPPATPPAPVAVAPPIDAGVDAVPERPIGDFLMTFYYIAAEEELASPAALPTEPPTEPAAVAAGTGAAREAVAPPPAPAAPQPTGDTAVPAPSDLAAVPPGGAANDNVPVATGDDLNLAAGSAPDRALLLGRDCQPLIEVSATFAAQIKMQGTGRLRDGRLINVAGACSCGGMCFHFLPAGIKWGTGSSGLPLSPFRMVAVDPELIKMGSLLYVPELDGLRMPGRPPAGGFIHDGCVVAADVGGAIKGKQLDLFVARRAYYVGLARRGSSHAWATSVEVWDGAARCTRRGSKVSRSAAASI